MNKLVDLFLLLIIRLKFFLCDVMFVFFLGVIVIWILVRYLIVLLCLMKCWVMMLVLYVMMV